jgi:phosphate/sulfate permease
MPNIASLVVAPVIGAVLAFLVTFGLVQSMSAGPDRNPAEQAALEYGQ